VTIRPIIVGVDASSASGAAAAAGWRIAQATGVGCQLVHAARDIRSSLELAGTGVSVDHLQLAMLARARNEIVAALAERVPRDVLDTLIMRTGRPARVLNDAIEELDAPMLVLGGKQHSTLGRWLGGSTVQQVARRLTAPLLVTAGDMHPRPRVLVAIDPSYAAHPTIEQAIGFARLLGGPLRALHVLESVPPIPEVLVLAAPTKYEAWSRERIERDIWTLLPIPDHHKVIRVGVAVETIIEEAKAWGADVIVVGSHGKGWVDRLLIGSVTEDLLNNLPAAVLVVPVPAPERRETASARARTAAAVSA